MKTSVPRGAAFGHAVVHALRPAPTRIAVIFGGLALGAYLFVLVRSPAGFMSPDDALYLGIGASIFAGRGITDVFGGFPPYHSPLWPAFMEAPHAWWGVDPSIAAHVTVVIAGAGVIALTAWFAWRAMPLAAALAAATMLGFPFLLTLARGMGLDLPASALTLLYVALGLAAVRRDSVGLAIAAGLTFACAFLVKEIALSFAPVPLLCGLVRNVPLRSLARVAGAILLAAMAGTSWWFVIYAQQLGLIYRLGSPAWLLGPLAVAGIVLGVAGLSAGRWGHRVGLSSDPVAGRSVVIAGWVGAILWAVALTVLFARTPTGIGSTFLDPDQVAAVILRSGPPLGSVLAIGLVGGAIGVGYRIADARPWRRGAVPGDGGLPPGSNDPHAIDDLLIATVCGVPLILLVLSVGETPRHYIVQIGFLVALGSAGWLRLVADVLRRPRLSALIVLGLGLIVAALLARPVLEPAFAHWRIPRLSRRALVALALVAVAVAALWIGTWTPPRRRWLSPSRWARPTWPRSLIGAVLVLAVLSGAAVQVASASVPKVQIPRDATRAIAVNKVVDWVRANVPQGSTVAFGSQLSLETTLPLRRDYQTVPITEDIGIVVDPTAPLGIRVESDPQYGDWIALRASPYDVHLFYGYRAGSVVSRVRKLGVGYWVQTVDQPDTPIIEALRVASGVTLAAHWVTTTNALRLETSIYRIDPGRLAFPDRVVVSQDALARIIEALQRSPSASVAAANLLARVTVIPDDAQAASLMQQLRRVAAP
jgi:hypothetical protein